MISVLIETYNHERFIRAAIESVLAQSRFAEDRDFEIIVVDDGSTDRTPEIAAEYGDRLRLIRKENGGQASAMTCGLDACAGDIVMMLDGDDWWHADKVARIAAEFEAHPDCVAVGHGIVIVDDLSGSEERLHPRERVVLNLGSDEGVAPFHQHMAMLGTSRLALRRAMLGRIGRPPVAITYESDEYFFTLLPALGNVHVLPECLTYYRLHGANLYQASSRLAGAPLDPARLAERGRIFRCLADVLSKELLEHGIPAGRTQAIVEPLDIAATRIELQTRGGTRAETLRIERRSRAYLARHGVRTRPLMRAAVLLAALLLPPPSFYALRTRYAGILAAGASLFPAPKGTA